MAKKAVPFNQKGIEKLPDNKLVVYTPWRQGLRNSTAHADACGSAVRYKGLRPRTGGCWH